MLSRDYPDIYVPNKLEEIIKGSVKPPKILDKPKEPVQINEPKFPSFSIFLLIVGIILIIAQQYWGIILVGAFFLAIIFHSSDKSKYPSELNKYHEKVEKYNKELDLYNSSIEYYKSLKKNTNNPEFKLRLTKEQLFDELKLSANTNIEYKNKKGLIEDYFLKKLNQYFPDEIYINRIIEYFEPYNSKMEIYVGGDVFYENIEEETNPYLPDFIFNHKETNLHIDIEIDEPYTIKTKEIIHAVDEKTDSKRDVYFLNNGWIVARFAEEQVIKSPNACCKLLAELIYKFTFDRKYLDRVGKIEPLEKIPRWKKDDYHLVENRYRENYLKNFSYPDKKV